MIHLIFILDYINTTIYKDITNYSLGLRFYLFKNININTLTQDLIFTKGIEIHKNNLKSLSTRLFMDNKYDDITTKQVLINEAYTRFTDSDIDFIHDTYSLVSDFQVLIRISDLDILRKDIKSLMTKRFGIYEAACKIPVSSAMKYKFDTTSLKFLSFDKINLSLLDTTKDYYTLEDIRRIYNDINKRISSLIVLYTIRNCKIPSGYPYEDI